MYGIEGLLAGRTLADRYRIEEVIGRGGMGAVYRAVDERLGRPVAVKIIAVAAPDPEAHARLRARFHREARAAARLHHPNIVAVYDFGTDPTLELDFLVMELLRGEDLASRLNRKGPPSLPTALQILHQAARGLAVGHRAGLIHRDVKPGNLHLEIGDGPGDLRVRVLDFGIAEITADDQTLTHLTVAGISPFSPAYASPEQLRGESRITPASDVFSLGAVGYHLVMRERAFTSSDPQRVAAELSASLAALRERGASLPSALAKILQRALAHDARDRFPDAGVFADALAPALSAQPATAPRPEATGWAKESERNQGPADHTRAMPHPPRRDPPARAEPTLTRAADAPRRPDPFAPRPAIPESRVPTGAPHPPPEKRPGLLHRAATAVWNFCLTCVTVGLFVGSWALAVVGMEFGPREWLYAGIAGSIALAPLVVHRTTGRRGNYRLALLGSVAASVAAFVLVGPNGSTRTLLAAMFGLQLVTSLVVGRFTRRRAPRHTPEPQHTVLGA